MKANEIFTLAIRLVGLLGIFHVVNHLSHVWHRTGSPHLDEPMKLVLELFLIVIGLCMIFFAPEIGRFFNREKRKDDK